MSIHVSVIDKCLMLNLNKNDHGLLLNVNDYIYNIYHKPLADFNKCKSVENKKLKKKTAKRKYICTCTNYLDKRKTRGNILIEKEVRSKTIRISNNEILFLKSRKNNVNKV